MGRGEVTRYAGADSTSGSWDAEKMQGKWTRKPERLLQSGPLGAPGLSPGSATGGQVAARSTEENFNLLSLLEKFP